MSTIGYINISLEIFGSILSLLLIISLLISESQKTQLGKIFIRMLLCHMIILLSDAAAWGFKGNMAGYAIVIVRIANFLLFCFGYVVLAFFTDYLVTFIGTRTKVSRTIVNIMFGLCVGAVLMIILSQFNGMFYIIDENNMYQRQKWFWVSQVYGIVGMVINAIVCLYYRKKMFRRDFFFLMLYILFPVLAMSIQIVMYGLAFLNIGMMLSVIAVFWGIQVEQNRQREMEMAESRVTIMLSQVQPHFLYNSLTAISKLCYDNPEAQKALLAFSNYLRSNMDALSHNQLIPFEKELEHVQHYLWLESLRFNERLSVIYDIGISEFCLPALTLQPIVENAVRYGVTKRQEGGDVIIKTKELEQGVQIIIKDNGVGFDMKEFQEDGRSHVGIESVRGRLAAMCEGELIIESEVGKGTIATIEIPKGGQKS